MVLLVELCVYSCRGNSSWWLFGPLAPTYLPTTMRSPPAPPPLGIYNSIYNLHRMSLIVELHVTFRRTPSRGLAERPTRALPVPGPTLRSLRLCSPVFFIRPVEPSFGAFWYICERVFANSESSPFCGVSSYVEGGSRVIILYNVRDEYQRSEFVYGCGISGNGNGVPEG